MSRHHSLQVTEPTGRTLTPEQKRFNGLLQKIERARERLSAWQQQTVLFGQAYAQRVLPPETTLLQARRDWAFDLDTLHAQPGWARQDAATLSEMIVDICGSLIFSDKLDDTDHGRLKALHDRHAEVSWDEANEDELADMKGMLEAVSGVDLGDEPVGSPEELLARAQEKLQARAEQQAAAADAAPPRRQSAAARRRAEEAKQATQSVREVYRKLASALHPDRVQAADDKALMTARMQRANQAYESGDLLTLLELQLEIEQVDRDHIAQAPAARVKHYNKVLAEQLGNLEQELRQCEERFCMQFGFAPEGRLDPLRLAPLIDQELRELRAASAMLARDRRMLTADRKALRRWLAAKRREMEDYGLLDDALFFGDSGDAPF